MRSASVIVPTVDGGDRLARLLGSLARQTTEHQAIVVDNGSASASASRVCEGFPGVEVVRLDRNAGFGRAINIAVRRAEGEAIVLVNDDSTCDPGFVEAITGALDPAGGVVMAAGVMRESKHPSVIDTAGMEIDHTLLVFDYLNGEPISVLDGDVPDPIGPSGAAAAFDRGAFLESGGFDERLFAYWEDVDLVLRVRRMGGRCALAPAARGAHEHSATLGTGSARKNYLMGFGRGYVLRKWGVLYSPRRAAAVLVRDGALCVGQAILDRNIAGLRGRLSGYLSRARSEAYPRDLGLAGRSPGAISTLRRRAARRTRLRRGSGIGASGAPR